MKKAKKERLKVTIPDETQYLVTTGSSQYFEKTLEAAKKKALGLGWWYAKIYKLVGEVKDA